MNLIKTVWGKDKSLSLFSSQSFKKPENDNNPNMKNGQAGQTDKRGRAKFLLSKKIIAALIMLALLFFSLPKPLEKVVVREGAAVTYHFDRAVEGAEFKGNSYRLAYENKETVKNTEGLIGTEVSFDGGLEDVERLLKQLFAVRVSCEDVEGVAVYTGYSALICGGIRTDKGFVNFQVAFSQGRITAGSPLIFGSY